MRERQEEERLARSAEEEGGERVWRDERLVSMAFDDGGHVVQRSKDGAIVALGAAADEVLLEGAENGLRLLAAGDGLLLVGSPLVLRVLSRSGAKEVRRITLAGPLRAACLVPDGVLFAQQLADDTAEYIWSPHRGKHESLGQTRLSPWSHPMLAADGRHLAWFVCRQEQDLKSAQRHEDGVSAAEYSLSAPELELARFDLDSGRVVLTELPGPVRALAVSEGRTWLVIHGRSASMLVGVWDGGSVVYEALPASLRQLTIAGAHAFAVKDATANEPDTLWRIALDTGRAEQITAVREGQLFNLLAGGGAVHWLEGSTDAGLMLAQLLGGPAPGTQRTAVCTLRVDQPPTQLAPKKKPRRKRGA